MEVSFEMAHCRPEPQLRTYQSSPRGRHAAENSAKRALVMNPNDVLPFSGILCLSRAVVAYKTVSLVRDEE